MWCIVKNSPDQSQDGATRIDKETGAIQVQIFPQFTGETNGGILEGIAWDGVGLWISGIKVGLAGNMLTRVSPVTGQVMAPFNGGTLGNKVSLPGTIAQGLVYDSRNGGNVLWMSDNGVNKVYKLDLARLTDGDPDNDNNLAVAEFSTPFPPKSMDWMGDKLWISAANDGIYEFNPANGATQKLFSTPQWNIDGIAILAGPVIQTSVASVTESVWIGDSVPDRTFTIRNGGENGLTYTVTENAPWFSVDPAGGTSTGEPDLFTISYTVTGLLAGTYSADITITAEGAINSPRLLPVTLTIQTVKPDQDGDGDVDHADFGLFQACLSGSGITQSLPSCQKARIDNDTDVDQDDFLRFQQCVSGANLPADPQCEP
jgi:hypothetical protein